MSNEKQETKEKYGEWGGKKMNETIEEIVRELRSEPLAEGGAKPWLHYFADRIEAAYKREVAELRELLKTILPYAEAGYCTRKTTRGCTGCPLSSIVSGSQYFEPICRIFKWRKALKGASND